MTTLFDLDREALEARLGALPAYRTEQLWHGLYRSFLPLAEISTLPAALRDDLSAELPSALTEVTASVADDGDTTKFLWRLHDGATVETVLMAYPERATVCVSTQAGCAMACSFCATGQAGFERNLSVGEIVEQVVRAAAAALPRRVSNIVFMGMGEPLANFESTWGAVERIHGAIGISARHLTISTVGLVPGILRLARAPLPVNLAVSLHLADDDRRNELVPINRRYPLAVLSDACAEYIDATHRRLSLEWAMIDGVNDTDVDVEQLAAFARPLRAHVNLIPLNRTPAYPTSGSSPERVRSFRAALERQGINATIRANRGNDIDAACGQLRADHEARPIVLGRRARPD